MPLLLAKLNSHTRRTSIALASMQIAWAQREGPSKATLLIRRLVLLPYLVILASMLNHTLPCP